MPGFDWSQPLLATLRREGIEPDQRMIDAIQMGHGYENFLLGTGNLFASLQILNTRGFGDFPDISGSYTVIPTDRDLEPVKPYRVLRALLDENADELRRTKQFGSTQYLRFVIEHAIANPVDPERPVAVQRLAAHYTGKRDTDLNQIPELQRLLGYIRGLQDGLNDYQYFLTADSGKVHFRIASDLVETNMENDSGNLIRQRALLAHFGGLGFFTQNSIEELEELINSSSAKEQEFQEFFERFPHFLRVGDHREVHPHVYLTREEDLDLIPDFILTNSEAHRATLLELKKAAPRTRLVRHTDNRIRFADAIMEARAQLLEYRDWFEQPKHRQLVKRKLGFEIYRPRMMVIIGRSSEFSDGMERAKLDSTLPDLNVMTYDDILRHATQRNAIIAKGAL